MWKVIIGFTVGPLSSWMSDGALLTLHSAGTEHQEAGAIPRYSPRLQAAIPRCLPLAHHRQDQSLCVHIKAKVRQSY